MAAARGLYLPHLAHPRRREGPALLREGSALLRAPPGSRALGVLQFHWGKCIPVRAWFRNHFLDTV